MPVMFFLPVELAEAMNAASNSIKSNENVRLVKSVKIKLWYKNLSGLLRLLLHQEKQIYLKCGGMVLFFFNHYFYNGNESVNRLKIRNDFILIEIKSSFVPVISI